VFSFRLHPLDADARRQPARRGGDRPCLAPLSPGVRRGPAPLPDYFVDAQTRRRATTCGSRRAAQEFIDSSISKTINCPEDIAFEAFKDVYQQAYDQGCKGWHHLSARTR